MVGLRVTWDSVIGGILCSWQVSAFSLSCWSKELHGSTDQPKWFCCLLQLHSLILTIKLILFGWISSWQRLAHGAQGRLHADLYWEWSSWLNSSWNNRTGMNADREYESFRYLQKSPEDKHISLPMGIDLKCWRYILTSFSHRTSKPCSY